MTIATDLSTIRESLEEAWKAVLDLIPGEDVWPTKNSYTLINALNTVRGGSWVSFAGNSGTGGTTISIINRLKANLQSLYKACKLRHATMPEQLNFENLPATIRSINPDYRIESPYGVVYIGTDSDFQPYKLTQAGWSSLTTDSFEEVLGTNRWATRSLEYDNGGGVKTIEASYSNLIVVDLPTNNNGEGTGQFLRRSLVRRLTYAPNTTIGDMTNGYLSNVGGLVEAKFPPFAGKIGLGFLQHATAYKAWGPITINSTAQFTGASSYYFMYNARSFTGTVYLESPDNAPLTSADITSLASATSSAPMYQTGITLTGPGAETFRTAWSNGIHAQTGLTTYRNLK